MEYYLKEQSLSQVWHRYLELLGLKTILEAGGDTSTLSILSVLSRPQGIARDPPKRRLHLTV